MRPIDGFVKRGNTWGGMKRLTLVEWEKKYIAGLVEGFDQKYQMFSRPAWDPEVQELLEDWSFDGEAKEWQPRRH